MTLALYFLIALIVALLIKKALIRLRLSRAKHSSLRGHAKWSRRIAKIIRGFDYDSAQFFNCDGAPSDIVKKRKEGFLHLEAAVQIRSPKSLAAYKTMKNDISDVDFTSHYRVPFPFRKELSDVFKMGTLVSETEGVMLKDIDGNCRYDLSGSYGVNVFGYDFYKACLQAGIDKVKHLGPVLGAYHPLILENVAHLKKISGLDEVSFHMSGTEAVMQAVRLARYHTGRSHLVRFCGAYHGWWDGVQPGIGNQRVTHDVYTLADLSEKTLHVLKTRKDIACVLINPMQAMHPNSEASSDATLIASDRATHFDRALYTQWLHQVRAVCDENNIVLIFDEVFTGFRLGYKGAQAYFNIQADLVTYGKTVGGGLPIGVLCGKHQLMKRFKPTHPVNISFARGTFNSHPYVMATMNEFLNRVESAEYQTLYEQQDAIWSRRVNLLNQALAAENLPVQVSHMHSVISILYTQPCRYNWMLQFYLRAQGLELSWIGTGRLIMSFDFSEDDYAEVIKRFTHAAQKMQADGWWWLSNQSNKAIKKQLFKEIVVASLPKRLSKPKYINPDLSEQHI